MLKANKTFLPKIRQYIYFYSKYLWKRKSWQAEVKKPHFLMLNYIAHLRVELCESVLFKPCLISHKN